MRIVIVFEDCKIQNQLPEKKPYTLKMSAMVGVFENCGFSARHYLIVLKEYPLSSQRDMFENTGSDQVNRIFLYEKGSNKGVVLGLKNPFLR